MAGHSKWANIRHKKSAQDKKRGKIFSRLAKKITSAARRGGGDPDANSELRLMIDKARAANVPNENIERAIKRGTGDLEGVSVEAFVYEGYGPGGVAFLLEGSTDNRNRTVAEIRHAFSKHGGNMGETGCVGWMFDAKGVFVVSADEYDFDDVMEAAIMGGAEDVDEEDGAITVTSAPEDFMVVREALVEAGIDDFMSDELTKIASTSLELEDTNARQAIRLFEIFEDNDDIESVYTNLEISDEIAEQLESS